VVKPDTWIPVARESACSCNSQFSGTAILFGGIATEPMAEFARLTIKKNRHGVDKYAWKLILNSTLEGRKEDEAFEMTLADKWSLLKGRFAMGVVQHREYIYYFGGALKYNKMTNSRDSLNEIVQFNTVTNKSKTITFGVKNYFQPRRQSAVTKFCKLF